MSALLATAAAAQEQAGTQIEEVVVTATRQAENLSHVPISVSAYTQEKMDSQGVKQVDDVVRLTPGIQLNRSGAFNEVSVRGIRSTEGASTTGIYIDDTPIQVRAIGYADGSVFPVIFDLERVEVLRGPQGTLFGASSEGGALRFIQPAPSLTQMTSYGRVEAATTYNGGASYEAGYAVGGPIVEDKLGFRVSAFYRHEGGYIDRVAGTPTVVDPTGRLGPDSVVFSPTGVVFKDSNWSDAYVARAALTWQPVDGLQITPGVSFQKQKYHDAGSTFWQATSDYDSNDFRTPIWIPTVDASHARIDVPLNDPMRDRFILPTLHAEWDLGPVSFVSHSAYFDRRESHMIDATYSDVRNYLGLRVPRAGDKGVNSQGIYQQTFSQEFRLQSTDADARFTWIVGAFYLDALQKDDQTGIMNFLTPLASYGGAVTGGAPYGPGTSAFVNYYGIDAANGVIGQLKFRTHEKQAAVFAQGNFNITEKLKATAGVRLSKNELTYGTLYRGPENNANAPFGVSPAGVPVGAYAPGTGPFTPAYPDEANTGKEHAVTPKFGLTYQADERNMFYVSASKGFRPGGAQLSMPQACAADLAALGYSSSPITYKSDSVWSYEAGAKNRLFDGRVQLDTSVYHIDWKSIQSAVSLPGCGYSFTGNVGNAESNGFDVQAQVQATDNLNLSLAVGHTMVSFKDESRTLSGAVLFTKGSAVASSGAPWTATLSGQYSFTALDRDAYIRGDWSWQSKWRRTGATDPGVTNYDPMARPRTAYSQLNLRGGLNVGDADLSVFINNVTNAAPHIGYARSRNQPVYTDFTLRPRTVGVTLSFRG